MPSQVTLTNTYKANGNHKLHTIAHTYWSVFSVLSGDRKTKATVTHVVYSRQHCVSSIFTCQCLCSMTYFPNIATNIEILAFPNVIILPSTAIFHNTFTLQYYYHFLFSHLQLKTLKSSLWLEMTYENRISPLRSVSHQKMRKMFTSAISIVFSGVLSQSTNR